MKINSIIASTCMCVVALAGCVTVESTRAKLASNDPAQIKKAEADIYEKVTGYLEARSAYEKEAVEYVRLTSNQDLLLRIVENANNRRVRVAAAEGLDFKKDGVAISFIRDKARRRVLDDAYDIAMQEAMYNLGRSRSDAIDLGAIFRRIASNLKEDEMVDVIGKRLLGDGLPDGNLKDLILEQLAEKTNSPKLLAGFIMGKQQNDGERKHDDAGRRAGPLRYNKVDIVLLQNRFLSMMDKNPDVTLMQDLLESCGNVLSEDARLHLIKMLPNKEAKSEADPIRLAGEIKMLPNKEAKSEADPIRLAEEIVKGLRYGGFNTLVKRIRNIEDRSLRELVAMEVLNMHMKKHKAKIETVLDSSKEALYAFTEMLPENACEELFDSLDEDSFYPHRNGCDFMQGLLRRMPREAYQRKLNETAARFADGDKISFEGFYCGMTWKDYVIVCESRNVRPSSEARRFGGGRTRLVFNRGDRYKLFAMEDGEFWSAYLQKYVPRSTKRKSLSEAIGDALDRGTFDYQEGWDDVLEERCYIYKSMKYETRVLFGQKTGTFVMEEYK